MPFPLPPYPRSRPEIIRAVTRELEAGRWTRLEGAPELERAWEAYLGEGHSWFLSSGTAAIEALLLGHGLQPGDEVITTPYTWGATVSAILALGMIPVFADIDYESAQIDPNSIRECITPRTRAILAVHLFGLCAPVNELKSIAEEAGVILLEDASQAHGASIGGRRVGTFGEGAAFSCMGMKPLGGSEGGFAHFASPDTREQAYLYGQHPRGIDQERVAVLDEAGLLDTLQLGWRPSAISAAIIEARLPFLDTENEGRRKNVAFLKESLDPARGIRITPALPGTSPVHHLLSFLPDLEKLQCTRDELLQRFRREGLPFFPYIPTPIHRMKRIQVDETATTPVLWRSWLRQAGVDYRKTSCPAAERRAGTSFEMVWNFTGEDPPAMEDLATRIHNALPR